MGIVGILVQACCTAHQSRFEGAQVDCCEGVEKAMDNGRSRWPGTQDASGTGTQISAEETGVDEGMDQPDKIMDDKTCPKKMVNRWKTGKKQAKDTEMKCSICNQCHAGEMFPFIYCMYCGQGPAYHHGRCCPRKPHQDNKIDCRKIVTGVAAEVRHTVEVEDKECADKLITKWKNDAEVTATSEQQAAEVKEWWDRTHGMGNPNVERLETGPLMTDKETKTKIKWTKKGGVYYLEDYEPSEQTMERMMALVRNYVYVEESPDRQLKVSWEPWKGSRWAINIKSQTDLTKIICLIYVSQYMDGTRRWIMVRCKSYRKWTKEMLGLREFIQKKLNEDNEDVTIANEDHIADMVGKEINKWIIEEEETFVELKKREGNSKETDNLDTVKAELERSALKLKLYNEMLSETSEMRGRVWSTFGPSSERAVQVAQKKVLETMKESVHELVQLLADRQWDQAWTDFCQSMDQNKPDV